MWTFSYLWNSPHKLIVHTDVYFPLLWYTQADSSTRTFSVHWHSLHTLTRPYRCFLTSAWDHTGQLIHADISFPLSQPPQDRSTTQRLFLHCHSLHWFTYLNRPSPPLVAVDERFICPCKITWPKHKKLVYHFPPLSYCGCVQKR